ncbi:hypothetical protein NB640_12280 [Oxalobacter vibrioformis]|uniref:Single-stranded DNA-binding protein BPT7 domain-containing protein n=1 Tax=Oxalobacter vibrioformis TaxID=933080 RepID=A0A9E9LZ95_9BURK|nr:hypothetical protein [Oxalobacter vibrioformis]WAW09978.1 hypothetical protein NB640_12280 [Oxalobacter vibrioformis]
MGNKKVKYEKVTTPEGDFSYPKLGEPDTKFKSQGEYSVTLVLPSDVAQPLIEKVDAVAQQSFEDAKAELEKQLEAEKDGKKKGPMKKRLESLKLASPAYKDCYDDDGNPNGNIAFRFKMNASYQNRKTQATVTQRPKIFDAKGVELKNPPDIWGGTRGCVAGQISPYYVPGTGEAGASLKLSAVQIIALSNGSSGGASSYGFGVKDGYEAEDDEPPTAAPMSDPSDEDIDF